MKINIAVTCYDAGASEILIALIKKNINLANWRIYTKASSPCQTIAKRLGLASLLYFIENINNLESHLLNYSPHIILYGTGWQYQIQKPFDIYAKKYGVKTIASLDHWTNYRERFGYPQDGWEANRPNALFVHDKEAYALAKSYEFKNIIKIRNEYQVDLLRGALEQKKSVPKRDALLYLSEPTAKVALKSFGNREHWGFTETTTFSSILEEFDRFKTRELIVRLHPSDSPTIYENILHLFPYINYTIEESSTPLVESLLSARIVLGVDSVALYTAYLLGALSISYIPSLLRSCSVPIPETNQIHNLKEFSLESIECFNKVESINNFGIDFAHFLAQEQIIIKER